jgi:hypothetical protein
VDEILLYSDSDPNGAPKAVIQNNTSAEPIGELVKSSLIECTQVFIDEQQCLGSQLSQ